MIISDKKATRYHTQRHNRQLVFTTIYRHAPISRAGIARLTDLTATTVSNVVSELVAERLVAEQASVPSTHGKPPILLRVNTDGHRMICLDLAGSVFQGAIANLRGEILHRISIPIEGRTNEAALAVAYDLVDALLPAANSSVLGIGVGAPGIVDPENGLVHHAVNFGWNNLPLRTLLMERYNRPAYVANASHAAVLAEYVFGHRKNYPDLVVIKVDHEVGSGIMLNGKLLLGHGFGAGEIGHVRAVEDGEICTCGNLGCLETVCSSRAILKRAHAIARDNPDSVLHRFAGNAAELDLAAVIHAFEAGDVALQALVGEVGHYLGIAISHIVGALSPPYVLITGSVVGFGPPLIDIINQEVGRRSLASAVSHTRVEPAGLGSDVVLLGAAALLVHYNIGVL